MNGFQQVLIGGYPSGGLTQDRKPALLANEAYSDLENAYVWRERTKKRDGEVPMGRLSRVFTNVNIGNSSASPWTFNLYTKLSITPETYAEIARGSVSISIATLGTPFVDQGNGTLTNATAGNSGTINYITGSVTLTTTVGAGHATTVTMNYYPSLPVMGILKRDVPTTGIDDTVFFDTKYAYQYVNGFQELATGTTWTGTKTNFFWSANYQGATPNLRYFFATNNNINLSAPSYDPIRYFNNSTWTDLQPTLTDNPPSATKTTLWQALIVIPYYGRLLALNTWEGATASTYTGAANFFARCRFSQVGDPTDPANAWRSDIFGRGGFLDAPTNEAIVSAAFFRNTLIVFFEYSTWQLRYIGEYGLPFIWERVSSDFGSVSPYSSVVFDQGVMTVSDRGIIQAAANGVERLDEQIPEQVFSFQIQNSAPNFVHGVRDFEKELVYWNYLDVSNTGIFQAFPNTTLVFNYRNNTWAKFRDTITCFGTCQFQFGVTWDSLTTSWDSTVTWDDVDGQQYVDYVVAGTQQGFINIYQNPDAATPQSVTTLYAPGMAIYAVTFLAAATQLTVANHNLADNEIIYIQNTQWTGGTDPGFNNVIFNVTVVDANTITLSTWNPLSQNYNTVAFSSGATYIGGGTITLFPKMNIQGKDFNPFQGTGKQFKLSFIDFQMDANSGFPSIPAVTVQLFINAYLGEQANVINTNQEVINSSQAAGIITNATKANPCQITSPDHSLVSGTQIYISGVEGMTQLNSAIYSITVVDANNFTLDVDSTAFSTYTSGGIWNTSPVDGQTYSVGSQYAWYRFYSTQFGQYLRIGLTYDDNLMNQLATHQSPMELNAMNIWFREGGRLIN